LRRAVDITPPTLLSTAVERGEMFVIYIFSISKINNSPFSCAEEKGVGGMRSE